METTELKPPEPKVSIFGMRSFRSGVVVSPSAMQRITNAVTRTASLHPPRVQLEAAHARALLGERNGGDRGRIGAHRRLNAEEGAFMPSMIRGGSGGRALGTKAENAERPVPCVIQLPDRVDPRRGFGRVVKDRELAIGGSKVSISFEYTRLFANPEG